LLAPPAEMAGSTESSGGIGRAWGSTFLLTLTNPMTILAFVAIFAGAGMVGKRRRGRGCVAGGWRLFGFGALVDSADHRRCAGARAHDAAPDGVD